MNIRTPISRAWRCATALLAAGGMTGLTLSNAPNAFADYGTGAQYQIEISDNCTGLQQCLVAKGDGVWLWLELNKDGTGDYSGADCVHDLAGSGLSGAFGDRGDVHWSSANGSITITGVVLIGGTVPVTITVPAGYGHYVKSAPQVFSDFPIPGQVQLQVAP